MLRGRVLLQLQLSPQNQEIMLPVENQIQIFIYVVVYIVLKLTKLSSIRNIKIVVQQLPHQRRWNRVENLMKSMLVAGNTYPLQGKNPFTTSGGSPIIQLLFKCKIMHRVIGHLIHDQSCFGGSLNFRGRLKFVKFH